MSLSFTEMLRRFLDGYGVTCSLWEKGTFVSKIHPDVFKSSTLEFCCMIYHYQTKEQKVECIEGIILLKRLLTINDQEGVKWFDYIQPDGELFYCL